LTLIAIDESRRASVTDSPGVVAGALARADETLDDVLSIIGFDGQFVSREGSHLCDRAQRLPGSACE
jgi:endonuclease V-like protein UPF0215 family